MKTLFNKKAFILIIISSVILALVYNYFSSDGINWMRKPLLVENVDSTSAEQLTDKIRGLSLAQVIQLHTQKLATFVDARDQWEYSDRHIEGAINIPEFSFDPNNEILKTIEQDKLLVIYCEGNECEISKRLAKQLIKLGYINTFVFLGGINEWLDAELPIIVRTNE